MADRLAELFSPERLRQRWESPPPAPEPKAPDSPAPALRARYQALLALLERRYPGAAALRFPLEELTALVDAALPPEAAAPDAKQREAIVAALESLEETLWALDTLKVRR